MITEKEYLQSLEIVKAYHKQLENIINGVHLTPIREYVLNRDSSVRLKNILVLIEGGYYKECHEKYIENIVPRKMNRIKGCGKKCILEFIQLRGY